VTKPRGLQRRERISRDLANSQQLADAATGARNTRVSWGIATMPDGSWTVERVDLLRRLWAAGETAAAIAARLGGASRSAVMGKVFRLRLGTGDRLSASATRRTSAGQSDGNDVSAPARRRRGGVRKKRPPIAPTATAQRKTLLELTNNSCRWPLGRPGKFFFCGAPDADLERGIPYCARHMRRAYQSAVVDDVAASPWRCTSTVTAAAQID
jgi:GcrA cell cycle regulator